MKFVQHRVADRRVLRLIQKWLKAGVSEDTATTPRADSCCGQVATAGRHWLLQLPRRSRELTSLSLFRARLSRIWRHQLRQRGDQRKIAWTKFARICLRYLPPPRTLHPHPYQRFNVTHPRWEPYA
jgi:hypothetical protein